MVRDINIDYLGSLKGTFPPYRLGPEGDVAKVDCTTCHQGAYKPLLGAKIADKYPELETTTDVASVAAPPPAPAPASAPAPAAPAPAAPAAPAPGK